MVYRDFFCHILKWTMALGCGGAASGATAGALGAAILAHCGYDGYDYVTAAKNGAIGGVVIGGIAGCCNGLLRKTVKKQHLFDETFSKTKLFTGLFGLPSASALIGICGHSIFKTKPSVMSFSKTMAAFLISGAIILAAMLLLCLFLHRHSIIADIKQAFVEEDEAPAPDGAAARL